MFINEVNSTKFYDLKNKLKAGRYFIQAIVEKVNPAKTILRKSYYLRFLYFKIVLLLPIDYFMTFNFPPAEWTIDKKR